MKRRRKSERGMTLIECMAALSVMMIGAMGMAGLHTIGVQTNSDARCTTRAAAIAQDLLSNIDLWPYQAWDAAGPLENTDLANDADIGDVAQTFEADAALADHGEADLPANFAGLPAAALDSTYERYWNVAYPTSAASGNDMNENGVADSVRIAVIVRWRHGAGWRRIVLIATKPNPAEL